MYPFYVSSQVEIIIMFYMYINANAPCRVWIYILIYYTYIDIWLVISQIQSYNNSYYSIYLQIVYKFRLNVIFLNLLY